MRSRRSAGVVRLLLAGMLVAGMAGRGLAQPAEPTGSRIVAVELDCDAPIDRGDLMRILPVHLGEVWRAGALEQTRARLAQTELFAEVSVAVEEREAGVAVIVHLRRKAIVNSIRFRGNDELGDDDLRRAARVREEMTWGDAQRDDATARIRERYAAEGFDAAQVEAEVRARSPGEVDVVFRIDEGPPLRVAAVEIEGTLPIPVAEIHTALGIDVGDRYTRAQQRRGQAAIVKLFRARQYYEAEVGSAPKPGDAGRGVLRFEVKAGLRFDVRFSGNHYLSDQKVLELVDFPTRPIVTDGTWRELARRAQGAYQEAGYYHARVDVHIEAGNPKVVQFAITEGEAYHVAEVSFEGNRSVSTRLLRAQMATRLPSWIPWRRGVFRDDVFDDDLKRLWYLYRREGFQAAEIVDARTRFDAERAEVFVTVFIEEGRQTIVRDVVHDGMEVVTATLPELRVVRGAPLNPEAVEVDRRALLAALAQAGYTRATVTATIDTRSAGDSEAATVRFAAVPGEQQRVGTIIVQNNFDTRSRVIVRELPFRSGEPLDPEALLRGQDNVYRLGLFRSVAVRPFDSDAAAATRDVAVNVSGRPAGTVQWGAGYNTRDGIRGFVEVGHNNLQGLARRLSLRGEFSYNPGNVSPDEYVANLGFREPRLWSTPWTLRANILGQRSTRSVDQFSLERFAFIPAIERTVLPGVQVGAELQVEQSRVFDVKPDVLAFNPRDAGRLRTISVGPFAVYDGRDDPFVPRRGVFNSVRLRLAPEQFGSEVPFVKLLGQHSQYIPLDEDFTFVYAVRGGWARAFEGADQVPIRERFFLGGRTTVRGFGENDIGPKGSQGNPLGGDIVLNLNTELRFPLFRSLGGVVFVDGGGLYLHDCPSGMGLKNCAISLDNFRRSAGLGVRYITPVGPISLEYGFKLDGRGDESIGAVHFSIGTIF